METKSRYEVIADLQKQKMDLIRERDSFPEQIKEKEIEIRDSERTLDDEKEDLVSFKDTISGRIETLNLLIASVDAALKSFNDSNSQKKQ